MSPTKTAAVLGLAAAALLLPSPASAEVKAVEITLFMPCDQETANLAIASLERIAGVDEVLASVGDLRVRILTSHDFDADPLSLVQVLWDQKIFPNRIYLEASGLLLHDGRTLQVTNNQSFQLASPRPDAAMYGDDVWVRAEVVDWIEDQSPEGDDRYTLHVEQIES